MRIGNPTPSMTAEAHDVQGIFNFRRNLVAKRPRRQLIFAIKRRGMDAAPTAPGGSGGGRDDRDRLPFGGKGGPILASPVKHQTILRYRAPSFCQPRARTSHKRAFVKGGPGLATTKY